MAEAYLRQYTVIYSIDILSLEDAGIFVKNMNEIYFQYFTQLYNGYSICIPVRQEDKSKNHYEDRLKELREKSHFNDNDYVKTFALPICCAVLIDNDPPFLVETRTDTETGKETVFRWAPEAHQT